MEDIIVKSHLVDFVKSYGFTALKEDDAFELFSIYCIVSQYIKNEMITKELLEEINTGSGGDWGLDGVLLLANKKPILNKNVLDDILSYTGDVDIRIVAIQAKTTPSFDVGRMGLTLDGVNNLLRDILGKKNLPPCNQNIEDTRKLLKYVYSKSADFKEGKNPIIDVFYVTCGVYKEQKDFSSKISAERDTALSTDLISDISCNLLGRKEIINLYKATKSKIEVDINVEQKIPLPKVPLVDDGYICLLPYNELTKLFVDDAGNLIDEVFYDNVRAYQGENIVNKAMKESIENGNIELFAAMNNGITIITKQLQPTGYNMHLSDYQIVNGCQTCNVLYRCQSVPNITNLKIAVKLIASRDKEIQDKIIIANNSQTEVKREQLVSLLPIQKSIEDYYNAQNQYEKLYYERRSKQYINEKSVPAYKVITIPNQIKAFVSMIMGEPDKVRGYYGSIVSEFEKNGRKVFDVDANPALYYLSALTLYKIDEAFSLKRIPRKYKKIKFHFLLALRLMCEKEDMPPFNSKKVTSYCDYLCSIICDDKRFSNAIKSAMALIDEALKRAPIDADKDSVSFTNDLKNLIREINKIIKERKSVQ